MKPAAGSVLNFAYGSNMLRARIQARVPSARAIGTALLAAKALRWHKRGQDGSGKCDIVDSIAPGAQVFGVLYELAADEKHRLDEAEGLGTGYEEVELVVVMAGRKVRVSAYRALLVQHGILPFSWYRALVVAGARQHRLPADYVAGLEAAPAVDDDDGGRHSMNMAIADRI